MGECEEVQARLGEFLSNEVDRESRTLLEQHLAECGSCQAHLAFLKGFCQKLAEAETTEYPSAVHARLTAKLAAERASTSPKVVSLKAASSVREAPGPKRRLWSYLAAASLFCALGLGLTHFRYSATAPEAVVALVDHHDTCFHIEPSAGREAQFDSWVKGLNGMPKTPTVSSELVAYDRRECPAGEVRAGHLMYKKGEELVSVYVLPAQQFLKSYGTAELAQHRHDGRDVVLVRKGDWVYGVVAALPAEELRSLVDTDHLAILRAYLAQAYSHQHG